MQAMLSPMTDSREDLIATFRDFSDEYILERLNAGELTDVARTVAEQELAKRGIDLPRRQPQVAEKDAAPDPESVEFITVARFLIPMDAHILRGRLEAEGIPAIVTDGNLVQTNNLLSIAVGGTRVQVPVSLVSEAIGVMAELRAGAFALQDDEDFGSQDR